MPDRTREPGRHATAAGFYDQLAEPPPYVLDLHSVATAAKSPGPARPVRGPAPGVLLISRAADGEFAAVARVLDRVGIDVARVNADELGAADVMADPARRAVRLDGRWLFPTVGWRRHFAAEAIEADDDGRARHLFRTESWSAAADHLVDVAATTIRSYRPEALAQLRLAERHGVAVPRTVLTTDPRRAAELLGGSRFVIKAGGPAFRRGRARLADRGVRGDRRARRPCAGRPRATRHRAGIRRTRCRIPGLLRGRADSGVPGRQGRPRRPLAACRPRPRTARGSATGGRSRCRAARHRFVTSLLRVRLSRPGRPAGFPGNGPCR